MTDVVERTTTYEVGDIVEVRKPFGWQDVGDIFFESQLSRDFDFTRLKLVRKGRSSQWEVEDISEATVARGYCEEQYFIRKVNDEMTTATEAPSFVATPDISDPNTWEVGDIVRYNIGGTLVSEVRGNEGRIVEPLPSNRRSGTYRIVMLDPAHTTSYAGTEEHPWRSSFDSFQAIRRPSNETIDRVTTTHNPHGIRIGDRVKYVSGSHSEWIGQTGTVISSGTEIATVRADVDTREVRVALRNLELVPDAVTVTSSTVTREPKVGDRVMVTDMKGCYPEDAVGIIGILKSLDGGSVDLPMGIIPEESFHDGTWGPDINANLWVGAVKLVESITTAEEEKPKEKGFDVGDVVEIVSVAETSTTVRDRFVGKIGKIVDIDPDYRVNSYWDATPYRVQVDGENPWWVKEVKYVSFEPKEGDEVRITEAPESGDEYAVGRQGKVRKIYLDEPAYRYSLIITDDPKGRADRWLTKDTTFWAKSVETISDNNLTEVSITEYKEVDGEIRVGDLVRVTSATNSLDKKTVVGCIGRVMRLPDYDGDTYDLYFSSNLQYIESKRYSVAKSDLTKVELSTPPEEPKTVEEWKKFHEDYKKEIVKKARIGARENSMCSAVDSVLIGELGLHEYYPTLKKLKFNVELNTAEAKQFEKLKAEGKSAISAVLSIIKDAEDSTLRKAFKNIVIDKELTTSVGYGGADDAE